MARKFEQWLKAKKTDPDDYRTQLEAAKLYREIIKPAPTETKNLKRKLTIEEFVGIEHKNETKL